MILDLIINSGSLDNVCLWQIFAIVSDTLFKFISVVFGIKNLHTNVHWIIHKEKVLPMSDEADFLVFFGLFLLGRRSH